MFKFRYNELERRVLHDTIYTYVAEELRVTFKTTSEELISKKIKAIQLKKWAKSLSYGYIRSEYLSWISFFSSEIDKYIKRDANHLERSNFPTPILTKEYKEELKKMVPVPYE